MMRRFLMLAVMAFMLGTAPSGPAMAGDPIVNFDTDDRQMNAAIRQARKTLPVFYRKAARARLSDGAFSVKVAFPYDGDGHEHIWVELRKRDGTAMEGVLQNNPVHVPYKLGQKVQFSQSNLSDWMYWEDGKMHGSYTTRVMLPRLPANEAAQLKAMMAPLPKG